MDPLSITTSAFALVGACRKIFHGFKFLKDLSRGPKEVLTLAEALNCLQNTVTAIGLVSRNHRDEFVGVVLAPL